MSQEKTVNFGYFVRWRRMEKGFRKLADFAKKVGVTPRRMLDIEKHMPVPLLPDETRTAIAGALTMKLEQLDAEWPRTPVRKPSFKNGVSLTLRTLKLSVPIDVAESMGRIAGQRGTTIDLLVGNILRDWIATLTPPAPPGAQPAAAAPATDSHSRPLSPVKLETVIHQEDGTVRKLEETSEDLPRREPSAQARARSAKRRRRGGK